jgi:hypothetical protein
MNPSTGDQEATLTVRRESFASSSSRALHFQCNFTGKLSFIEYEYERGIPIRPDDGKYVGPASEGTGA